jgi:hypothetical protein
MSAWSSTVDDAVKGDGAMDGGKGGEVGAGLGVVPEVGAPFEAATPTVTGDGAGVTTAAVWAMHCDTAGVIV